MQAAVYFDQGRNGAFQCEQNNRRFIINYLPVKDRPDAASAAVFQAINKYHSNLILTPLTSKSVQPIVKFAGETHVPVMAVVATGVDARTNQEFYYPLSVTDNTLSKYLVDTLTKQETRIRVLALTRKDDVYSRNFSSLFRTYARAKHLSLEEISFIRISEDLNNQLKAIDWAEFQAILLPFYQPDLDRIVPIIRQLGFSGLLIGSDSWELDKIEGNPIYSPALIAEQWHPLVEARYRPDVMFTQEYKTLTGTHAVPAAALTFDALQFVEHAVCEASHYQPTAIRKLLRSAPPANGITGVIHFNEHHQIDRKPVLIQIRDNQMSLIEGNNAN